MRPIDSAAAILICLMAGGCRFGERFEAREVPPELTMEGVRFWIDRGGLTQARGRAEQLTLRRDTTDLAAQTVTMLLSGAEGEVLITAATVSGVISERRFSASGGIAAERGDDRAVTDTATFEPPQPGGSSAGLVHGHDPVAVTGPGYRLDGSHGFTLDPSSGQIVLGGGARLLSGLPVAR
jgi:hypothetical protein